MTIAIGGWTLSDHFSTVAATEAGRETMARSIETFLDTYRMFDGVDFDWEYPGGGGEAGNSVSPDDGANYALLLANVRGKLDALGARLGRTYEISVAAPGGSDKIATFNAAGMAPHIDYFNLMSYDFHGTWENTTGHQSAFTGRPDRLRHRDGRAGLSRRRHRTRPARPGGSALHAGLAGRGRRWRRRLRRGDQRGRPGHLRKGRLRLQGSPRAGPGSGGRLAALLGRHGPGELRLSAEHRDLQLLRDAQLHRPEERVGRRPWAWVA